MDTLGGPSTNTSQKGVPTSGNVRSSHWTPVPAPAPATLLALAPESSQDSNGTTGSTGSRILVFHWQPTRTTQTQPDAMFLAKRPPVAMVGDRITISGMIGFAKQ